MKGVIVMRSIKRTISLTACVGQRLNPVTGQFIEVCEVLEGIYTREQAQAHLRRTMHDDTVVVSAVEPDTHVYVLSGSDFMKYAVEQ